MAGVDDIPDKGLPRGRVKRFIFKRHLQDFIARTQAINYRTLLIQRKQTIVNVPFCEDCRTNGEWLDEIENHESPLIALRVTVDFFIKKRGLDYHYEVGVPQERSRIHINNVRHLVEFPDHERDIILNFAEADVQRCQTLLMDILSVLSFYYIEPRIVRNDNRVISILSDDPNLSFCCNIVSSELQYLQQPENVTNKYIMTFIDTPRVELVSMTFVTRFVGNHKELLISFLSAYVNIRRRKLANKQEIIDLYGFGNEVEQNYNELRMGTDTNERDGLNRCVHTYERELKRRANSDLGLCFELRNSRDNRVKALINIVNDIEGIRNMKEAMVAATQNPGELSVSDFTILVRKNMLQLSNQQSDIDVANTIFEHFRGSNFVSIRDIELFVLLYTPYVWRKAPMRLLENSNRITGVVGLNNQRRSRGTFPERE